MTSAPLSPGFDARLHGSPADALLPHMARLPGSHMAEDPHVADEPTLPKYLRTRAHCPTSRGSLATGPFTRGKLPRIEPARCVIRWRSGRLGGWLLLWPRARIAFRGSGDNFASLAWANRVAAIKNGTRNSSSSSSSSSVIRAPPAERNCVKGERHCLDTHLVPRRNGRGINELGERGLKREIQFVKNGRQRTDNVSGSSGVRETGKPGHR